MFKINRIKYKNHPVLGDEEIFLVEENEKNNLPYLSLIIGQNGTGKSKILNSIVDIILYLKKYSENSSVKWVEEYTFEIDLYNGIETTTIIKTKNGIELKGISKQEQTNKLKELLPKKVLASAYTFNDNFLFPDKKNDSAIYQYSGIRTVSNAIFIKKPSEKVFKNLQYLIVNNKIESINPVFDNLLFNKKIEVNYIKNISFNKLIKSSEFNSIIKRVSILSNQIEITQQVTDEFKILIKQITGLDKKERNPRFADDAIFRELNNQENLQRYLFEFVKTLINNDIKLKTTFKYSWEQENNSYNSEFIEHINLYDFLSDLDIISFDYFSVSRKDFFDFSNASSGEFHFLHLYSSLAKSIDENSIVLIDEPEISLHPNWQQSWYNLLKPLLDKYNTSHLIVSSHSHLIVSDLPPANSSINTLRRKDNVITIELLTKFNPFAWSTEQVLLDVFEMATDRNFYLADRMQNLVEELTKSNSDIEKIKKFQNDLKQIDTKNLDKSDPLNEVLAYLLDEKVAKKS